MGRRWNAGTIVLVLAVAEIVAFALVVKAIGLGPTLLLGLVTTVLGIVRLRRLGLEAFAGLRGAVAGRRAGEAALVDGTLAALGAVLLVLPGFLTDLVGLALLAPSGRDWVRVRLGLSIPRRRGQGPAPTVDLGAGDWTRLDGRTSH